MPHIIQGIYLESNLIFGDAVERMRRDNVRELLSRFTTDKDVQSMIMDKLTKGDFTVLDMALSDEKLTEYSTSKVFLDAARHGYFARMKWIEKNYPEELRGWSSNMHDSCGYACIRGDVPMAMFMSDVLLVEVNEASCLRSNCVEMIEFCYERKEVERLRRIANGKHAPAVGIGSDAMRIAVEGDCDVTVQWLIAKGLEFRGKVRGVKCLRWLLENRPEMMHTDVVEFAWTHNRLDMLKLLHEKKWPVAGHENILPACTLKIVLWAESIGIVPPKDCLKTPGVVDHDVMYHLVVRGWVIPEDKYRAITTTDNIPVLRLLHARGLLRREHIHEESAYDHSSAVRAFYREVGLMDPPPFSGIRMVPMEYEFITPQMTYLKKKHYTQVNFQPAYVYCNVDKDDASADAIKYMLNTVSDAIRARISTNGGYGHGITSGGMISATGIGYSNENNTRARDIDIFPTYNVFPSSMNEVRGEMLRFGTSIEDNVSKLSARMRKRMLSIDRNFMRVADAHVVHENRGISRLVTMKKHQLPQSKRVKASRVKMQKPQKQKMQQPRGQNHRNTRKFVKKN